MWYDRYIPTTINNKTRQFVSYCIGGGIAALVDIGVLYVATDVLGLYYIISAIIAFSISVVIGYAFQKHITFKSTKKGFVKFVATQLIGLGGYVVILYVFTDLLGIYYIRSAVITKLLVLLRNYTISKKHIF